MEEAPRLEKENCAMRIILQICVCQSVSGDKAFVFGVILPA